MSTTLINDLINRKEIHFGDNVLQIIDLFARKQESTTKLDDKFFSQYWQAYAWCAILGFHYEKRIEKAELPNKQSFYFHTIWNGSQDIAHGLILMALGALKQEDASKMFDSRKLLTIISEHAEGGAKYVLDIKETPGLERKFDSPDDYLLELLERK